MSRLYNLLGKVNNRLDAKDIHPALKQAVFADRECGATKRRNIAFVFVSLGSVILGGAVVFYLGDVRLQPRAPRQIQTISAQVDAPPRQLSSELGRPPEQIPAQTKQTSIPAVVPAEVAPLDRVKKSVPEQVKKESRKNSKTAPMEKRQTIAKSQPSDVEEIKSLAKDPSLRDAYLLTAREMEGRKEFSQALKYYKQAYELAPDNYRLLNNISGLSLQAGQPAEAVVAATQVLKMKKDFLPALINLGIAKARMAEDPEAMVFFARAYTLDPTNRGVLFNIALLQERSGRLDEAAVFFRRLADGGDPQGLQGLGRIFEKQQKVGEAITVYREILASPGISFLHKRTAADRLTLLQR